MKKTVKLLLVGLLILGMVASISGCGKKADDTSKDAAKTEKPVLTVGSETTYAPMEFSEKGEYVGFDMDLIRAIGKVQGYEVKISSLGFDALIPALKADKVDCAISSITINEERKKAIDFSNPYFQAGLIIAVAKDNNDSVTKLDDLAGRVLAGEVGTTGLAAENSLKEKDPKTEVKTFDSVGEAFMELEKGGAYAVVNDMPITSYYIKTTGKDKVKMVGDVFAAEDQYGIGVKKGNTKMLNMLNEGLGKLKANGEYDKIYTKWFGDEK